MADDPLNVVLLAGRFEARGTSSYTLRLAKRLSAYDISPLIVCSDARQIDSAKKKSIHLREYRHVDVPLIGRVVREWIIPPLQRDPPDLIHIQSHRMLPLGTWLSRRLKKPFVLTIHQLPGAGSRVHISRRYGRRVIAVSASVKDALLQQSRLPDDFVTVIHSGVEAESHSAALRILNPDQVAVVGTAGPLESIKGVPYFLAAAQKVLAVRQDVEFLVAGAGPEETNLRRLARRLQIDRHVTFVPNLHDFGQSLSAMDIFCLPSIQQGLGTIMLEAMAKGRPVIASGVGGVYSIIRNGETGFLVPPSESRPLADRILDLLADPVRARAIGEAGRSLVCREFHVETMVQRTAELYREIVGTTVSRTAVESSPSPS